MDNGLYILAAAMDQATRHQEAIAFNLANSLSPGYKERLGHFNSFEAVYSKESGESSQFPFYEAKTDYSQGSLRLTSNPLDIALFGDGFLAVEGTSERKYTRGGHFMVDSQNYLATQDGFKLLGQDGPIQLQDPAINKLCIDSEGKIFQRDTYLGQLLIVDFKEKDKLLPQGGYLAKPEGVQETQASSCKVSQGYIESSTVDPVSNMTQMVTNMREFEAAQRIIRDVNGTWEKLIQQSS